MTMTWQQVGFIMLTGLFSAPHCIGMCGGIVSAVSLNSSASAHKSMLLYNAGRVLSYTMLGAVMGVVGSFVDVAGKLAGVQGLASIIGGCFLLLWLWRRFQLPLMHRLSAYSSPETGRRRKALRESRTLAFARYGSCLRIFALRLDVCDADDGRLHRLRAPRGGRHGVVWTFNLSGISGCCVYCLFCQ